MVHIVNLENGNIQVVETNVPFEKIMAFVKENATEKKNGMSVEDMVEYLESEGKELMDMFAEEGTLPKELVAKGILRIARETECEPTDIADAIIEVAYGKANVKDSLLMTKALGYAMSLESETED
jgi:hypothetical protein